MRMLLSIFLALVAVLSARAQGPLLIQEIISREAALFIGADADLGQVVSREVALFSGADADGKQAVSREVSLAMADSTPPPQVAGVTITGSPTGATVTLDWSSYHPWAVRDVREFRIYRQDAPFTSVSGLEPLMTVGAETLAATLTGLTPWRDHFFAVVAVDALGNLQPQVAYRAFYVLSAEVISREVTLLNGDEPSPPHRQVVSREVSLCLVDAATPPAVTPIVSQMSADGSALTLSWTAYNPWAVRDVREFRIYRQDAPFSSVAGLEPLMTVGAETLSVQLSGLPPWRDHFFAVVAVDALGNVNPVAAYAAGYILMGEVVSREVCLFVGQDAPGREAVSREVSLVIGSGAVPAPVTGVGSGFTAVTSVRRYGAIDLDWSSYNEAAQRDVAAYRVYAGREFFSDITGMTPQVELRDGLQTHTLTLLEAEQIYYVAVVAVDSLGGFNAAVYSISAKASVGLLGDVANLAAVPNAYFATFTWDLGAEGTNLAAFVREFRLYFQGRPVQVLPAASRSWTALGLVQGTPYTLRVTTVDLFGTESAGATLATTTLTVPPGLVDESFGPVANGDTRGAAVQADGRIVITGAFTTMGGVTRNRIARLMPDGTLDAGFNPNANAAVSCVTLMPDGRLLVGGEFTTIAGVTRNRIARLMPDGTLDASFTASVNGEVRGILPQEDGRLVVSGGFTQVNGQTRNRVARLDEAGVLDTAFHPNVDAIVLCLAPQTDGRLIITGSFAQVAGVARSRVARLHPDGSLDTSFASGANDVVEVATVQQDDRVLLGGRFTTVGGGGRARLARLNADGSLDAGFAPDANGSVISIAPQMDGRVIVAGDFTTLNGTARGRIGRLNADGSLDATFTPSANQVVYGAASMMDGRVLVVGNFTTLNGINRSRVALLTNDPATQSLEAVNSETIRWQRGGSSPLVRDVAFDLSTDDGLTWQPLGTAALQADGWRLGGLQLPPYAELRARSSTRGGLHAASISRWQAHIFYEMLSSASAWRGFYFGENAASPEAQDAADPDQDGVPNLMERAFALHPRRVDARQLPAWTHGGGQLRLIFDPPPFTQAISYGAEWSTTLMPEGWQNLPDLDPGPGLHFALPLAVEPRVFARLKTGPSP